MPKVTIKRPPTPVEITLETQYPTDYKMTIKERISLILDHKNVSTRIAPEDLLRLMPNGDLAHIGDAMVAGKPITIDGKKSRVSWRFDANVDLYGVVEPKEYHVIYSDSVVVAANSKREAKKSVKEYAPHVRVLSVKRAKYDSDKR